MNWWRWWLLFKENEVVVDDDANGIDYTNCLWQWLWRWWWWCPLRLLNDLDNDDGDADDGDDDDGDDDHRDDDYDIRDDSQPQQLFSAFSDSLLFMI